MQTALPAHLLGSAAAHRRGDACRRDRVLSLPGVVRSHLPGAGAGRTFLVGRREVPGALRPKTRRPRTRGRRNQPAARNAPPPGRGAHRRTRTPDQAHGDAARTGVDPAGRPFGRRNPHLDVYAHVPPRRDNGVIKKLIIWDQNGHSYNLGRSQSCF